MPNDMSPPAASHSNQDALLRRAARFIDRAKALAADPALDSRRAAEALDHLARMQGDLSEARLSETRSLKRAIERAEVPFCGLEADLKAARAAMSEALLHAVPDPEAPFGLVPHGPAQAGEGIVRPASACRAVLDLEALRPFLSDHAITQAIARRAKETGQCDVAGVTYAKMPRSANLTCAVL